MAEETMDAPQMGATRPAAEDRTRDLARMRRIGAWHTAAILAALTLWGAGATWAAASGLGLAHAVALGNAIVAGIVISSILHEWGHFAGARLSGAVSPVLKKPARFYFMFNFDMAANSTRQFVWMSLGGILANWLFVLAVAALVPLSTLAGAMLFAVAIMQAVNVSVFEVPIVLRVRESDDPQYELDRRLEEHGLKRTIGLIAGALVFLALT